MLNFRTDLAIERRDIYKVANGIKEDISGIETEKIEIGSNVVTRVKITNNNGAEAIGKPIGNYITIDIKNLKMATEGEIQNIAEILSNELKNVYKKIIKNEEEILVVGLGNSGVTPDALGPNVVKDLDITRHLIRYAPNLIETDTRSVSAIAPGVLGTTGLETQEILKGIIEETNPKLVIAIDSLASQSIERISSTIQIADTGIVPGAGVNNARKELSKKTLGIPVIAIGIPTVVDAATIAADAIDLYIENLNIDLEDMKLNNKYELIKNVLSPKGYNLIVTPKEIDGLLENMSSVLARGLNMSF